MENILNLTPYGSQIPALRELQRVAAMLTFYRETAFGDPFASQTDKENAVKAIGRLTKQQDEIRKELFP